MKNLFSLARRHLEALWYVLTVILPALATSRKRPIVFSRMSGIGDILCSFPAVPELIRRHPGCFYIYNCDPGFRCLPVLAGLPVRVTSTPHIGLVRFWYGWLIGKFYAFEYIDAVPGVTPYEMLILEFARSQGVVVADDHPRLKNDPAAVGRIKKILDQHISRADGRRFMVIHAGPSWPVKEWPAAAWASLVAQLRRHGWDTIFQLGVNKYLSFETAQAPAIPGVISLVDELSLAETIALISQADLFIGIDSGLLHLAASVQTPAVGIWGPTSPLMLFSPADARFFVTSPAVCQGCQHRYPRLHWLTGCPHDILCMKNIAVDTVFQACLNALAERG